MLFVKNDPPRFNQRDIEADGPESFTSTMRMFADGRNVPFPGEIFSETWALARAAAADSTALDTRLQEEPFLFDEE